MNFLQLFFCATLTFATVQASPTLAMPVFRTSTDVANYVKNSLMQDLETINLLDREMATPVRRTKKFNRELRKRTQVDPVLSAKIAETHSQPVKSKFSQLNKPRRLNPLLLDFDDSDYIDRTTEEFTEIVGNPKETRELIRHR